MKGVALAGRGMLGCKRGYSEQNVVTVVRVLDWKIWFFTANANAARASIDLCYFLPHPG
jgi:hypothetical protein